MQPTISPERWLEHLDAWKQTDLTQADYCRMHGLRTNQFWYWKSKLQSQAPVTKQKITSGFAIAQFETVTATQQTLSVTLPDGTTLNDIDAANIKVAAQLLEVLR
ncbi:hypothetical protein [Psychromonas sp.]|uniref:IS66 family insertion sequence element accessory protein TnpA n=1 Tax=Psychromonas sp. TaxID=1884585 RepID=UPI00356A8077